MKSVEHAKTTAVYRVRAEFLFRVRGLLVRSEVLGTSVRLRRFDADIEIKFPSESDPAFASPSEGGVLFERDALQLTSPPPSSRVEAFSHVYVLLVAVRIESQAEDLDEKVNAIAESVITDFIDWQRIRGQTWLGLHGQKPEWFTHPRYVDESTGSAPAYEILIRGSEILEDPHVEALAGRVLRQFGAAVDLDSLSQTSERMTRSETPALAEQILADALYFGDRWDPELARAVLFAAIACELKTKDVLRTKAPSMKRQLLDLLLENPRDFSMQVAGLFDKALKATLGCSLKEQDRKLFNRIERLFQLRNKIAHQGEVPSDSSVDCIRAAREVFKWLDAVSPT